MDNPHDSEHDSNLRYYREGTDPAGYRQTRPRRATRRHNPRRQAATPQHLCIILEQIAVGVFGLIVAYLIISLALFEFDEGNGQPDVLNQAPSLCPNQILTRREPRAAVYTDRGIFSSQSSFQKDPDVLEITARRFDLSDEDIIDGIRSKYERLADWVKVKPVQPTIFDKILASLNALEKNSSPYPQANPFLEHMHAHVLKARSRFEMFEVTITSVLNREIVKAGSGVSKSMQRLATYLRTLRESKSRPEKGLAWAKSSTISSYQHDIKNIRMLLERPLEFLNEVDDEISEVVHEARELRSKLEKENSASSKRLIKDADSIYKGSVHVAQKLIEALGLLGDLDHSMQRLQDLASSKAVGAEILYPQLQGLLLDLSEMRLRK
ncbi:MAG: hypothetical protein MMC23_001826 [Stictis urceolatum]|nr:hypothetical protein [Stictis urceolata]